MYIFIVRTLKSWNILDTLKYIGLIFIKNLNYYHLRKISTRPIVMMLVKK
jgi:hypothetical protein